MGVEAAAVRRILRGRATLVQSGIGPAQMAAALARIAPGTLAVILAGVAGGLRPTSLSPRVRVLVASPEHAHGGPAHIPHWSLPWSRGIGEATLVGDDEPSWTAEEKGALAAATDADIVDCETHALAAWAGRTGIAWGVVRGVSDGPLDELPRAAVGWMDDLGTIRPMRVARDLVVHPALIPRIARIQAGTASALRSLAPGLDRLLDMVIATPAADQSAPAPRIGPMPIEPAARRILIFGGTFDPPHRAHTDLALLAMRTLACDALTVIPAARSPHKAAGPATPDADRVAMLELAFRGHPGVSICTAELERAGDDPATPSYTIDTLRELRAALGPDAELRLLMGADQAAAFHTWRDPRGILAIATPAVMLRAPIDTADALAQSLKPHWSEAECARWRSWIVPAPVVPISATAIRDGASSSASVLAPAVAAYAQLRGLYRNAK
jgi:nicotinate-nucleotide adenylyltransferase